MTKEERDALISELASLPPEALVDRYEELAFGLASSRGFEDGAKAGRALAIARNELLSRIR